jgi:hypothetical protein
MKESKPITIPKASNKLSEIARIFGILHRLNRFTIGLSKMANINAKLIGIKTLLNKLST